MRPSGDPIRIVEAVTAGVAFLAAGTIIQTRGKVHGITTGAGMWLAGAIGLCCGAGLMFLASATTVLVLAILLSVHLMESRWLAKVDQPVDADEQPTDQPTSSKPVATRGTSAAGE